MSAHETGRALPRHCTFKNQEMNMIRAGLDGPSRRIIVTPQEQPTEAPPAVEPAPAETPAREPEKVPA